MSVYTLALESSCDETSAAILKDGRTVLSNVISSQVPIHRKFGGCSARNCIPSSYRTSYPCY